MPALKDLEIGAMFWAGRDPRETLREVKALGVSCGQLGVPGDMPLEGAAEAWTKRARAGGLHGRDGILRLHRRKLRGHPDRRADGRVHPAKLREPNASSGPRTSATSLRQSGSRASRATSGSFRRTGAIRSTWRFVTWCGGSATMLPCTGRRSRWKQVRSRAEILLEFLKDVDRKNLGINFDPANLIMYGTGDPIQAVEVLHEHLLSVHARMAYGRRRSPRERSGPRAPLGEGSVGMDKFIAKLKQVGYKGTLERRTRDRRPRAEEDRHAARESTC